MTQQVQELIDKIKKEGLQEAQKKTQTVIDEAKKKAEDIISQARKEADDIMTAARKDIAQRQAASNAVLKQAARDMLLDLRKQIEAVLQGVLRSEINQALDASQLARLIETAIVKNIEVNKEESEVTVILSPADLKKFKEGFITKLKERIKLPVTFESEEKIHAGFMISFDKGKSRFDFSDESLVEYLGSYLNQELADLLKKSLSS